MQVDNFAADNHNFVDFDQAKRKFRKILGLFFLLFSVALGSLIYFTSKQLEKDSLLNITESVDEIVFDFEEIFVSNLEKEAKKGFSEYSHFNIPGQNQKLFYKYTAMGDIDRYQPGFLGYFQISPGGVFLSPVYVPSSLSEEGFRFNKKRKRRVLYNRLVRSLARFQPLQKEPSFLKLRRKDLPVQIKQIKKAARRNLGAVDFDIVSSPSERKKRSSFIKSQLSSIEEDGNGFMKRRFTKKNRPEKGMFSLILSDNGYLLAYREVVHNKKRYLQGFLVDFEVYFARLLESIVRKRYLVKYASFNLEYGRQVLLRLGEEKKSARYYVERPMSFVHQGLKLNTIINKVPVSQSSRFFYFLIGFSILVVVISFGGLYRLGVSQIELARQRTNFVSSVSHELRTPLTSISMYSEMLRSSFVKDTEKLNKYYDFIFFESGRLTRLINNILRLNNINNNQEKIEIQQFNANALLDMIVKKVELQVQNNGFDLTVTKGEDVNVEVDEDCFTQIFINVVDNAIKFSKESEVKKIDFSFYKNGSESVFALRDYGPGIAPEHRGKVFDLFHRAENEITRKTAGTGIGLALVFKLAEQMNAKVELHFPEPGTEFRLILKA